jgi:hypothetical protein
MKLTPGSPFVKFIARRRWRAEHIPPLWVGQASEITRAPASSLRTLYLLYLRMRPKATADKPAQKPRCRYRDCGEEPTIYLSPDESADSWEPVLCLNHARVEGGPR